MWCGRHTNGPRAHPHTHVVALTRTSSRAHHHAHVVDTLSPCALARAPTSRTHHAQVWPHYVVLASELFGSEHISKNYMFYDGVSGAVGSLVFANFLPSAMYQAFAVGNKCFGFYCFGPTHAIISVACAVAALVAFFISSRSAPLYAQITASKKAAAAREATILL